MISRLSLPFLAILVSAVVAVAEHPNLIFILTDDQRDNTFSGMGHPWVQTPHVDALLKRSIRFENTYIAEPICRPSRAGLLLGNHERVNRNGFSSTHRMTAAQWQDSYPVMLQRAGYRTGYVGKWHVLLKDLELPEMFDFFDGHPNHGPFYFEREAADGSTTYVTTNRHHTDNAVRFLRSDHGDTPFCLSIAYATPHGSKVGKMHQPYTESASVNPRLQDHPIYGGKYRDIDIPYPQQHPINPYDHIPQRVMDQDEGRNTTYRYIYDPVSGREHHYRYYQMVTEIDQMVGELVATLEEQGLADNTVIIYGSDHGLLMGEYGMGGKGLLYDLSVKIPCFIHDPRSPTELRGSTRSELVSSLDLTVTLLDYAGVSPTSFMTGRSLTPFTRGETSSWRTGLFLESMYTGRDTPIQEGYVQDGWKYIRYHKAPHPYGEADVADATRKPVFESLFNLNEDPTEQHNRVDDPACAEVLASLRQKCQEALEDMLATRQAYAQHYGLN